MSFRLLITMSVYVFIVAPTYGDPRQRPVVRISLEVSASPELKGIITSYLARELRKIDDVIVSDTRPLFRIGCVAMKNYNQAGYPVGYTLSFATTNTMPGTLTGLIAKSKLSPEDAQTVLSLNSNRGVLVYHFVQVCGTNELQSVCRQVVTQMDGELIESARQFAQTYAESLTSETDGDDLRATPSVSLPGVTFETVEQSPQKESVQSTGQLDMHSRLLTPADVKTLTDRQMRDAINELYARHGLYFGDSKTRRQFEKESWYHPRRGVTETQIEAEFTDVEAANVKLLGESRSSNRSR